MLYNDYINNEELKMRIRITFAEAENFIPKSLHGFTNGSMPFNGRMLEVIGEELAAVLCEDYFAGAEKAVIYLGVSMDDEYFEFDLIPN
jgi:hypothetical protein